MNSKLIQPWISAERIEGLVQLEPMIFILGLTIVSLAVYKFFLKDVSQERHRNLTRLFKNLSFYILFATISFVAYSSILRFDNDHTTLLRVNSYVGLFCILCWTTGFVKVSRIILFEYLFIRHMREGVPLLLVNLLGFVMTIITYGWIGTELFKLKVIPLLATSAVFSLVLGLALQDTLGNLFAGLAMQFDKPYQIGDWVEIVVNDVKFIGKVDEISWRATVLIGIADESISVPNRLMGQTQISNFSTRTHPICRSQLFRVAHGTSIEKAKQVLAGCIPDSHDILKSPAPFSYAFETNDSYVTLKLVYYLMDFGRQFLIGDIVIRAGNEALARAGINIAPPRMRIMKEELHEQPRTI